MSPSRGNLDPHQFRNAHHALDSSAQLFHDTSNSNPRPPDHAVLMDATRFDDFPFPFPTLPNQPPLLPLADQTNVTQPTDTFAQHPSVTAMDHTRPVRARGVTFATPAPDHPRDISDTAPDRNSPMANSLEDSAPDEFGLASHRRADGTDLGGKAKEDKADSAPAWSELKTKAGKERKRLPLACIACRRKKIRCSGEKPACKHCLRSRIPCVYKVTTRKAAPRTDYMAMLDKRLKRMEERIIKVIPKSEQDNIASVTRAVVKPPVPGAAPATKGGSKKRGADEAFGPDLEAWARGPSKPKIVGDDRPNSLQVQEEEENKLLHEGSESLPPKDVQEQLAEVFFDNVYGQSYHLLHKPSYMRKLKNNTLPPVLILSVCAVAARFSTNPQLLNTSTPQFLRGEEWASQARDICVRRYEWPNLTILTCLLILGLHEFGTCQGGRSWALGGQAIRMAFALQLHRDLDHDPTGRTGKNAPLSFVDREIRRRIMWACFLMDRFNSSGTDRPMFVREEQIHIPLPIKERYFQLDMEAPTESLDGQILHPASPNDGQLADARENMGVAAFMIRSIAIWGQIVNYLNQGGKEMDSHLMWDPDSDYAKLLGDAENFGATLTPSMRYSSDNVEVHKTENTAAQFFFLHICIQHNILFLNRAALNASQRVRSLEGPPKEFLAETSAKMVTAANRISDMLKESERLRQFVSAPFAGYCAFSSTSVHIAGLVCRNPSMTPTAEANLATNVKYLHKMKKYWGMFHWMVEEIRSQYRKSLDSAMNGNTANEATVQTSILQYGDWFNRYPHGVSDTEFMDPATYKKKDQGADAVLEAKPELQSVEEFMSTLSPSQNSETRDGARGSAAKRKSVSKKQTSTNIQQGQQHLESISNPELGGQTPEQLGVGPQQQRRFSGAVGGQTSGPTGFSPLTVPHSQASFNNTMSPLSPGNVGFPHHAHVPPYFPPDLLAMNLGQQANGSIQPLFGGYSMEGTDNMAAGPNMMDGVDWESMATGAQTARGPQARRSSVKGGMNGQVPGPVDGNASFDGQEASSAWFMPFNLEPPQMSQDMGLGVNNVDPFAGMFNGGGSGLTTPNPLNGLQHGP